MGSVVHISHVVDITYTQFSVLHKILLEPNIVSVGKCPC